jgi:endoglucanase
MSYFWSQWMSKYWTSESVQWLEKDWGATVVRAAMGADESDGYIQNPELNRRLLTTVVDAAIDSGIYVIIDWHSHHAEQFTNESVAFFGEMAQTYGAKPNVIFELFNEPTTQDWSTVVKPYHEAVLQEIRKHSDNLVILGTPTWSQDVDIACSDSVDDDNVAYTLHFYAGTHRQSLRDKATAALDNGCALFVTEWGTCGATGNGTLDFDETKLWTDFMDANHLSSANWAVSDKHESCSALQADASTTGGWVPAVDSDLTYSGLYVRDYVSGRSENIQCDGEGWPCVAPLCSDPEGECLATKCCGAEGYTCFAKDNWWAQCMRSCGGPGQEDWSCDVLAPEALVV